MKFEIKNKRLYYKEQELKSFTCYIGKKNIRFYLFYEKNNKNLKRKILEIINDGSVTPIFKSKYREKDIYLNGYNYYYCLSFDNFCINVYTDNKIEDMDDFKQFKISISKDIERK